MRAAWEKVNRCLLYTSSQFFICDADSPHLDGSYAAFGTVVFGLDEVDRIAALKVDMNDRPLNPPVMVSVFFVTPLSDWEG